MKFYHIAAFLAVITFPPPIRTSNSGWSDPSKAQYHIQTDEGPERYFRYQTISGQYRKEKRLEDGTVIGTYGWVDDDGIFRMRDYIADNAGYRILKTKNVFVGRNRPVSQALSIAKQAPAEAGTLVGNGRSPSVQTTINPYITSPQRNILPAGFSVANVQAPVYKYAEFNVPQTTPSILYNTYGGHTPDVELSLNSIPSSTESPQLSSTLASQELTSPTSAPSVASTTPSTIYIPSTTPSSVPITPSTHYQAHARPYESSTANYETVTSTLPPPLNSNALDTTSFYSSNPQYEHYPNENKQFINPYIYQNGPTYPIDKNGNTYNGYNNNLGNGYNPQFPLYDGVSVTNDGFRYYIPKQYHEEQTLSENEKSGSFGYVDPFGIRRVIYYNAGPDGFKHRKNNRYVGFDATPYDPRPY